MAGDLGAHWRQVAIVEFVTPPSRMWQSPRYPSLQRRISPKCPCKTDRNVLPARVRRGSGEYRLSASCARCTGRPSAHLVSAFSPTLSHGLRCMHNCISCRKLGTIVDGLSVFRWELGTDRRRTRLMASCRRAAMVTRAVISWALIWTVIAVAAQDAPSPGPSPAVGASDEQPENFAYYQLWADQEGETHFTKCRMMGFNLTAYASLPQFVRSDFGGEPTLLVFTELAVGLAQPLHSTPSTQFVVTLFGSWYIETTDGTRFEFQKGDVLFQDNTADSPADKAPQHYSGTIGNQPCQQLVVQISRPPQVDVVCPF